MGVKVLSLFDGMACGMLAFQKAGISVDNYCAYEIDKYAIQTATQMQLIYVAITQLMVQVELPSLFVSLQEVGIQIRATEQIKQTLRHISTTKHEQTARPTLLQQYKRIILSVNRFVCAMNAQKEQNSCEKIMRAGQ